MRCTHIYITLIILVFQPESKAYAHGGGLNAAGCHNDRVHGGYHCHRGEGVPAPVYRKPARTERADIQRPVGIYQAPSEVSKYEPLVEVAQKLLLKLGFNTGTPDGILGSKTEQAVTLFQESRGLPETGKVDMPLIDALIEKLGE